MAKAKSEQDKLMAELLKAVKSAKKFSVEQAPDVVREMLEYERFNTVYNMCLVISVGIALAFVSAATSYIAGDACEGVRFCSTDTGWYLFSGLCALGSFFFGVIALEHVPDLYKVFKTPKLFLIEELSDLIKSD